MATIVLVGPGRAGMAVALALQHGGHHIAAVAARNRSSAVTAGNALDAAPLDLSGPFPSADLLVLSVRDDAITSVAEQLASAPDIGLVSAAVHLSGLTTVAALSPLAAIGLRVGSMHPLQTLPSPETGARRLRGAWIAVTTDDATLESDLGRLAHSIGAKPFHLDDSAKPLYHAAASAAANFTTATLAMADDLFAASDVPFEAARPLVEAAVANAFELGPLPALTGPIIRGDTGTVASQIAAVDERAPAWSADFRALVVAVARLAGRREQFAAVAARGGALTNQVLRVSEARAESHEEGDR